jgi:hypothetical protein
VERKGTGPPMGKILFGEVVKFIIIDRRCTMSTLEVVAMKIMALEVANASGRMKNEA